MYSKILIVAATFLMYTILFLVNELLFGFLGFSESVHWVYLPSGLRLMLVLIFVEWGALGIVLASMFTNQLFYFGGNTLSVIVSGCISGLAPYLARHVCHRQLGLDLELRNLSSAKLLTVSLVFALISAFMHQVFFAVQGHTDDFIASTSVMAFGDLIGTVIFLYTAKFVLSKTGLKTH
jgi:hypothetical protein